MTRISSRPPVSPRRPAERAPAVKAETKKQLKASFDKLIKTNLSFGKAPANVNFTRVPLQAGKGPDQYSYAALIPTGGKAADPNKAGGFLIERSGGFAGRTEVTGPFSFDGKKVAKPAPFFERFLEGQKRPDMQTMRYPSDNEAVEPGTKPGKPDMQTMRYPSDNEAVEPGTKPGKPDVQTMRYPSDNEAVEPSKPGKPDGGVQTKKFPSDNEDVAPGKPTKPGGGVQTKKFPSDNEDVAPGKPTKPGGTVQTMRYPSDNEDVAPGKPTKPGGTVQTMRYPSDNESVEPTKPGGTMQTMRYPSDNEDGGIR